MTKFMISLWVVYILLIIPVTSEPGDAPDFNSRRRTNDSRDGVPPVRVHLDRFGVELLPVLDPLTARDVRDISDILEKVIVDYLSMQESTFDHFILDGLRNDAGDSPPTHTERNRDFELPHLRRMQSPSVRYTTGGIASFDTPEGENPPQVNLVMKWIEDAVDGNLVSALQGTSYQYITSATFESLASPSPGPVPSSAQGPSQQVEEGSIPWLMIGGIAAAVGVVGFVIIVGGFFVVRKRKHSRLSKVPTADKQEELEVPREVSSRGCTPTFDQNNATMVESSSDDDDEEAMDDIASDKIYTEPVIQDMKNSCDQSMDRITLKSVGSASMFPHETESFQHGIHQVIRKDMLHTTEAFSSDRVLTAQFIYEDNSEASEEWSTSNGSNTDASTPVQKNKKEGSPFVFESSDNGGDMVQIAPTSS